MRLFMMVSCLLYAGIGLSMEPSALLQSKLNAIRTMTAAFKQEVVAKKKNISKSSGTMALSRPGRFRWKTTTPMEQLVIADGSQLWIYDPDLEQVSVKKQEKGVGGTAALFLSGYDETLSHDFSVTMQDTDNKQWFTLKALSPKENFQMVKLIFAGNALDGIELFDQLGQHTIVHLSDIKINPTLASTLFSFKPPKGVDVVEQ